MTKFPVISLRPDPLAEYQSNQITPKRGFKLPTPREMPSRKRHWLNLIKHHTHSRWEKFVVENWACRIDRTNIVDSRGIKWTIPSNHARITRKALGYILGLTKSIGRHPLEIKLPFTEPLAHRGVVYTKKGVILLVNKKGEARYRGKVMQYENTLFLENRRCRIMKWVPPVNWSTSCVGSAEYKFHQAVATNNVYVFGFAGDSSHMEGRGRKQYVLVGKATSSTPRNVGGILPITLTIT